MSTPVAPGSASPSWLVRYGNFMFHWRNTIFPVVLLTLFFTFRPAWPGGDEGRDNLLDLLGVLIAFTGQALRVAVIGYKYIVRGGKNQRVYAEDLVTSGFFAHARNPLYLGNILVLLGLFVVHNSPWVYAIGVPFFLLGYIAIVAAEENFLRGKFGGAYEAYCRDVPRWIPRLGGLSQSLAGIPFNWRRVILKEYGSTYAWLGGAIVLMVADTLSYRSYGARAQYLNTLWWCVGIISVLYVTARWLKLSRRLRDPQPV